MLRLRLYIQDSEKPFQSSEYGFWYAYNTKIETNTTNP